MVVIKKFRIKSFKKINSIIEFENVSLAYGNRLILDNISFKINEGVSFGMLGPNGVGKSTIFNLITGLISPSNGKIKISGEDVTHFPVYLRTKKFKTSFCPQYGGFFNDLSLLENLKAIGEIILKDDRERISKINNLISKFALDNVQEVKAKHLSGGQRRKLVICMALLGDPKILLCDEIFAALDVLTIHMLKEILVNLQKEKPNMCIVITEHQARELLSIVDRAMILSNCKIIAEGSPNKLIKDEKAKTQYFGDFF